MKTHEVDEEITKEKFTSIGYTTLDSKNRVTLGNRVMEKAPLGRMEVDAFGILMGSEGDILLRPMANVPSRELWIYQNPKVLKSIQNGLQDAQEGKITEVKDVKEFLKKL